MSETWTPPAPPIENVWYDLALTKANVLAALRLTATDIDVPRIEQAIPTAAHAIDQFVDRVDPLPAASTTPALQSILDRASITEYHILGTVATIGAGAQAAPIIPGSPFDPLVDVRVELLAFKQRWGIA
jgi:hypothetical protein